MVMHQYLIRSRRRGGFGEELFTLSSTYVHGKPPKSVNFYWRRFRIDDIPLDTQEEFDVWLRERWYEKDALMEQYVSTGRFPPSPATSQGHEGFLETEVRTRTKFEFLQIFVVIAILGIMKFLISKIWSRLAHSVW